MSGVEVASALVMLLGAILTIVCVALPYWKTNDPEDTVRDNIVRHEGLWIVCQTFLTGNWDCDDFNRFFVGLPIPLQAARGLSITAVLFSLVSTFAMFFGMEAIPCGSDSKRTKRRIRLMSGIVSALGGLLIIAAVSWYANNIRIEHDFATLQLRNNAVSSITRYIFGVALFIGWGAGTLLILGGILAICTGCGDDDSYEDAHPRYAYRPPTKPSGQEYV